MPPQGKAVPVLTRRGRRRLAPRGGGGRHQGSSRRAQRSRASGQVPDGAGGTASPRAPQGRLRCHRGARGPFLGLPGVVAARARKRVVLQPEVTGEISGEIHTWGTRLPPVVDTCRAPPLRGPPEPAAARTPTPSWPSRAPSGRSWRPPAFPGEDAHIPARRRHGTFPSGQRRREERCSEDAWACPERGAGDLHRAAPAWEGHRGPARRLPGVGAAQRGRRLLLVGTGEGQALPSRLPFAPEWPRTASGLGHVCGPRGERRGLSSAPPTSSHSRPSSRPCPCPSSRQPHAACHASPARGRDRRRDRRRPFGRPGPAGGRPGGVSGALGSLLATRQA